MLWVVLVLIAMVLISSRIRAAAEKAREEEKSEAARK